MKHHPRIENCCFRARYIIIFFTFSHLDGVGVFCQVFPVPFISLSLFDWKVCTFMKQCITYCQCCQTSFFLPWFNFFGFNHGTKKKLFFFSITNLIIAVQPEVVHAKFSLTFALTINDLYSTKIKWFCLKSIKIMSFQ